MLFYVLNDAPLPKTSLVGAGGVRNGSGPLSEDDLEKGDERAVPDAISLYCFLLRGTRSD